MKQKSQFDGFGQNPENPFEGDILNRDEEIKNLTPMIKTIASPAVMALDAPWGAGKTAFIKMWAAHLVHNEKIPALYFNAWESDSAGDPLAPFVESIQMQLPQHATSKLMDSAVDLIPLVAGDVVRKLAGDALAGVTKKSVKKLLTHRSKMDKFKAELRKSAESDDAKRIVVFVDELDRCRPDYAIKVLERIKHLFEVPGLIFVLAVNFKQLRAFANAVYGAQMDDAEVYLRRFIEFDFSIEEPNMLNFLKARLESLGINQFLRGRNSIPKFQGDREKLLETLDLLARLYAPSLRDTDQLLMRIVLVLYSLEDQEGRKFPFYPTLLAFLVLARQVMPVAYGKYILPDNNGDDIIAEWEGKLAATHIFQDTASKGDDYSIAAYITAHLIVAKNHDNLSALPGYIERYKNNAETPHAPRGTWYRKEVARLIESIANDDIRRPMSLPYLAKKIRLADKFRFSPADGNKKDDGGENS